MIKNLLLLPFFCICSLFTVTATAQQTTAHMELSQGYKRDKLDFTVSGPHGKPNILSELIFKDIHIYATRLCAEVARKGYFVKGIAAYGKIVRGRAIDNDYLFDNRKGQFSHSTHDITGEYTSDYALRVGKNIPCAQNVILSPYVGYSAHIQKLRFRHGKGWVMHPLSKRGRQSHEVHGLNSTYKSNWYAPELGLAAKKPVTSAVDVLLSYTLLFPLKYDAHGYWNLRDKKARHFDLHNSSSRSFGNIFTAGVEWRFTKSWAVKGEYEYMKFYAKGGHQKVGKFRAPMHRAGLTSNEIRISLCFNISDR